MQILSQKKDTSAAMYCKRNKTEIVFKLGNK